MSAGSASNDFFGRLKEAATKGLEEGVQSALPRWVGKELDVQSEDQLNKSTFDASKAPRRIDQLDRFVDNNQSAGLGDRMQAMGLDPKIVFMVGVGVVFAGFVWANRG